MLELSEEEAELRKNPCAPIERKPAGGRGFGERDGRGRGRGRGEGGRGGGRDWEERGPRDARREGGREWVSGDVRQERAPRQPRDSAGSDGVPRSPASGPGGEVPCHRDAWTRAAGRFGVLSRPRSQDSDI